MTRYAANAPDYSDAYEEAFDAARDERVRRGYGSPVSYPNNGGAPVGPQPLNARHPSWDGYVAGTAGQGYPPSSGPITSRLQNQGMGSVPQSPVPLGYIPGWRGDDAVPTLQFAGAGQARIALDGAPMSWPPWFRNNHKTIQWVGWAVVLGFAVFLVIVATLAPH